DPTLKWEPFFQDGNSVERGKAIVQVSGSLQSLLKAERTALNFLQHLSGIATQTGRFVEKIQKFPVKILDTRKTTPGLRAQEKQAVRMGGGKNHRLGLYDRFLIKENHLESCSIAEAIQKAKEKNKNHVLIEIEVGVEQVEEAIAAGATILLLDNFSPKELKKAVKQVAGRVKTEASGGIHFDNLVDYAKTGVDFISIGALTHSAPAADISMLIH
ncbi:MAG: carboxylating nicotinate-nucleotide diphosphorylase, partial [bacterium]|nr:carboxylating nicotinate-nucleotide diphosphorylase [bacterium]